MALQTAINVPESPPKRLSLHETILEVLSRYGPRKQGVLAAQLGAKDGHLSEVLKGSGQKHWPAAWLDYIAEHYDFEASIARHFASLHRPPLEVTAPRVRPAQEEVRRLRYVLRRHNALGEAIEREADSLPDDVFADFDDPQAAP